MSLPHQATCFSLLYFTQKGRKNTGTVIGLLYSPAKQKNNEENTRTYAYFH